MLAIYNPLIENDNRESKTPPIESYKKMSHELNNLEENLKNDVNVDGSELTKIEAIESDDSLYIPQPLGHSEIAFKRNYTSKCTKYWSTRKKLLGLCCLVCTVIALVSTYLIGNIPMTCLYYCQLTGTSFNPEAGVNITLLGDSLMTFPYNMFSFANHIRDNIGYLRKHPNQSIIFYDEGKGADTISKIAERIDSALSHNSQGLILFWDTDVSDFSEKDLSNEEVQSMRAEYEYYLRYVIEKVRAANTTLLGIAGPAILGENSLLVSPYQPGFWGAYTLIYYYTYLLATFSLICDHKSFKVKRKC